MWFKCSIALILLAGYFIFKLYQVRSKQRKLEWENRLRNEEQDKIRQRTAEDFHDELGNKLTRINLLSSIAISKMNQHEDDSLKNIVHQIQQNITSLYKGSKDIIWSLQPQSDYLSEIFERVRTNALELLDGAGIEFHYDMQEAANAVGKINIETQKLNPEAGRNIIMIFKEGVNNIIKHAAAKNVNLEITVKEDAFLMHLKDDGFGIDVSTIQFGNGIKNMRRRAERIRATFHFGKNEIGSYIEIIVPLIL